MKMKTDFQTHNFHTTSDDMFTHTEDLLLQADPVWHGTAIGWPSRIDRCVSKLPVVCDRFCGIEYKDAQTDTNILAYSVYFPTSGRDDDFLEVVSSLSADISLHNSSNTGVN